MKIEHSEITGKKFAKGVFQATCTVTNPIRSEVNMKGISEQNAIDKLKAFLNNEPYDHIK